MRKQYNTSKEYKKIQNNFRVSCEIIKKAVEDVADIYDLGIPSRKAYIRDCRFSYFQICKELSDDYFSLQTVADVVNRESHGTVLNGLEEFEYQYGTDLFLANEVYKKALKKAIKEIQIENKKLLKKIKKLQINEYYLISQMEVVYKLVC